MNDLTSHLDDGSKQNALCIGCEAGNSTAILRRATQNEFEWMIALRNQIMVRQWFFDSQNIDFAAGCLWLASRASSNDDTVLLICHKATGFRVGTVGWICTDPKKGVYETGRLALHSAALRKLRKAGFPRESLDRIAIDACLTLRDHLFNSLKASVIRTEHKAGNILSAKISAEAGLLQVGKGKDGRIFCQITRDRWHELLNPVNTK